MNTSSIARLGLVGLAYGTILVTGAADAPREASEAAKQAERTVKALGRHDAAGAIAAAEQAVRFAPTDAGYRLLLGQSYLQAGRFVSAAQAFGDTLALDGSNGKAALNLALTQIATGDWQTARRTLGAHSDTIPAADRGLAMALAGDTEGAVALLTEIARSPAATPKVRQNLALSYALAGQWQAARVVAAADMSPADVDARLQQWAAFSQPDAASDQVASLLGVRPVNDVGQPTALALNAPVAPVAVARAEPVPSPAPVVVAIAAPVVQAVPAPTPDASRIAFAPRHEVVQALPAALIARASGPVKVAVASRAAAARPSVAPATRVAAVRPPAARPTRVAALAHKPASGTWFVQLGAYANAGVAHDDWGRARRRYAAFAGHTPQGATIKVGAASFYRLSVGGFARADADHACQGYRAAGGHCFVRTGAGEQVASWAGGGSQVAARATPKSVQVASR